MISNRTVYEWAPPYRPGSDTVTAEIMDNFIIGCVPVPRSSTLSRGWRGGRWISPVQVKRKPCWVSTYNSWGIKLALWYPECGDMWLLNVQDHVGVTNCYEVRICSGQSMDNFFNLWPPEMLLDFKTGQWHLYSFWTFIHRFGYRNWKYRLTLV